MTRTAPFIAALGLAAAVTVASSAAVRPPITQAASGQTFHLAQGEPATLRLASRWRWSEPRVSSNAVELTPVEYFVDPGFLEWTIEAHRAGRVTISATGTGCTDCVRASRHFAVTLVVGSR